MPKRIIALGTLLLTLTACGSVSPDTPSTESTAATTHADASTLGPRKPQEPTEYEQSRDADIAAAEKPSGASDTIAAIKSVTAQKYPDLFASSPTQKSIPADEYAPAQISYAYKLGEHAGLVLYEREDTGALYEAFLSYSLLDMADAEIQQVGYVSGAMLGVLEPDSVVQQRISDLLDVGNLQQGDVRSAAGAVLDWTYAIDSNSRCSLMAMQKAE